MQGGCPPNINTLLPVFPKRRKYHQFQRFSSYYSCGLLLEFLSRLLPVKTMTKWLKAARMNWTNHNHERIGPNLTLVPIYFDLTESVTSTSGLWDLLSVFLKIKPSCAFILRVSRRSGAGLYCIWKEIISVSARIQQLSCFDIKAMRTTWTKKSDNLFKRPFVCIYLKR